MDTPATYPVEAVRTAYTNGVQHAFSMTDIKRAFMEGIVAIMRTRREPAPQWMVDTLWRESDVRQRAEHALQGQ